MDTIDRIKVKNDQLKYELRQLIQQDSPIKSALNPIDLNPAASDKKPLTSDKGWTVNGINKKPDLRPDDMSQFGGLFERDRQENDKSQQTDRNIVSEQIGSEQSHRPEQTHRPVNGPITNNSTPDSQPHPVNSNPHRTTKSKVEPYRPTSIPPIPPPGPLPTYNIDTTNRLKPETNPFKSSTTHLNQRNSVDPPPSAGPLNDNLLITKILSQDQQIGELKQIISQLKRDNNTLQQQVYQQPILINQIKQQSDNQIEQVTSRYQQQLQSYDTINNQLMTKIADLTTENQQFLQQYQDVVDQLKILQQDYDSLVQEEYDYKLIQDKQYQRLKHYQSYLQISNRLIQSNIINRFVDKCDEIGLLIDNDLNVHNHQSINNIPRNSQDNDDEYNTDYLLGRESNTTDRLLAHKHYPTVEQLIVNNTTKRVNKWRVVAKYLVAVNRFKGLLATRRINNGQSVKI